MCVCVCVCVCVSGKVHGKKKNKGFFWSPGYVLVQGLLLLFNLDSDYTDVLSFKYMLHACVNMYESVSHSVVSKSFQLHGLKHQLLCPWTSPFKNTGVVCHFLLQGIFVTQGLNPGLLHFKQFLYHLRHQAPLVCILYSNNKTPQIRRKLIT